MFSQDKWPVQRSVLALNYALNGDSTRLDVLRSAMEGLRRGQLDDAVKLYSTAALRGTGRCWRIG